jgi:hypothetical protein
MITDRLLRAKAFCCGHGNKLGNVLIFGAVGRPTNTIGSPPSARNVEAGDPLGGQASRSDLIFPSGNWLIMLICGVAMSVFGLAKLWKYSYLSGLS